MTILELTNEEQLRCIDELYECFENSHEFEIFLQAFLTSLGFEEVVTAQYVGEKGIDLTCIKSGLDINGSDTINYYVQAKRYASGNKVQAKEVRDFKGATKRNLNGNVLNSKYIKVFITTSFFTRAALAEATSNPNLPVITIDGAQLVQYCIERGIGFHFKPVFAKNEIKTIIQNGLEEDSADEEAEGYMVARAIAKSEIRSRVLVVPQLVKNELSEGEDKFEVVFNGVEKTLTLD